MKQSAAMRTITGLITLMIYGVIGTLAWPTAAWLTYVMGVLALVRLVLLIRQLPTKQ